MGRVHVKVVIRGAPFYIGGCWLVGMEKNVTNLTSKNEIAQLMSKNKN